MALSPQIQRLQRRMDAIPMAVREAVRPALVKSGEELADAMRGLAPEDTGALKESIAVTLPGGTTPAYSQPGGSRVAGDTVGAVAFAYVGVAYAAVGGLLLLAGDRRLGELSAAHLLIAATAVLLATAGAAIGVADAGPAFLSGAICAGAVFLASVLSVSFDMSATVRPGTLYRITGKSTVSAIFEKWR